MTILFSSDVSLGRVVKELYSRKENWEKCRNYNSRIFRTREIQNSDSHVKYRVKTEIHLIKHSQTIWTDYMDIDVMWRWNYGVESVFVLVVYHFRK